MRPAVLCGQTRRIRKSTGRIIDATCKTGFVVVLGSVAPTGPWPGILQTDLRGLVPDEACSKKSRDALTRISERHLPCRKLATVEQICTHARGLPQKLVASSIHCDPESEILESAGQACAFATSCSICLMEVMSVR
eukprot:1160634-Pelagomonas_calceolata.AAC.2